MTVSRAEWCRQQLDRCRSLDDLEEARENVRPHMPKLEKVERTRIAIRADLLEDRLTRAGEKK